MHRIASWEQRTQLRVGLDESDQKFSTTQKLSGRVPEPVMGQRQNGKKYINTELFLDEHRAGQSISKNCYPSD